MLDATDEVTKTWAQFFASQAGVNESIGNRTARERGTGSGGATGFEYVLDLVEEASLGLLAHLQR